MSPVLVWVCCLPGCLALGLVVAREVFDGRRRPR